MRTFFAFPLTNQIKDNINEFCNKNIFNNLRNIKKVDAENLHITIKFLGEINEELIIPLKQKLLPLQYNIGECETEIKGVGVFPSHRNAHVLWVGIYPYNNKLLLLHENIIKILNELKISSKDDKKFHPHITIARFKQSPPPEIIHDLLKNHKNYYFGKQILKSFILYKSILTPQKPIYTPVLEFCM